MVLGIVIGLAVIYMVLLLGLFIYARRHPDTVRMVDALRLLPDLLRALRRMAADRTVPAPVRWKLALLIAYLLLPFDLIPDFLPVIGQADDVIVLALVLRSAVRSAGADSLRRHWPGSQAGLAVVERLAGLGPRPAGN